jgi:hypothetical protein
MKSNGKSQVSDDQGAVIELQKVPVDPESQQLQAPGAPPSGAAADALNVGVADFFKSKLPR